MLVGEFLHTIDNKGRVILPAKFREKLGERLVATKGLDGCLFVYGHEDWAILENKLKSLPLGKAEARAFVRFFFGGAAEVECDRQGRMLLPQNLRDYANLDKDVAIVGVGNRIEIWDQVKWQTYNEQTAPTVTQITEDLADLGI